MSTQCTKCNCDMKLWNDVGKTVGCSSCQNKYCGNCWQFELEFYTKDQIDNDTPICTKCHVITHQDIIVASDNLFE